MVSISNVEPMLDEENEQQEHLLYDNGFYGLIYHMTSRLGLKL